MINRATVIAMIALGFVSACEDTTSSLPASLSEPSQRRDLIAIEGDKIATRFGAAVLFVGACRDSHGITPAEDEFRKQKALFDQDMIKRGYTPEEIDWAFNRREETIKRRIGLIRNYLSAKGIDPDNDPSICKGAVRERKAGTDLGRLIR